MKKRFIPTIIAFVVLIVLGVYSNYYETEEILPAGEVKPVAIVGCTENDVKAISFGNKNSCNLKITIDENKSMIVAPAEYPCDYAESMGVARSFAELESEHYFYTTASDSGEIYGFTETSPRVKIETKFSTVELALGCKVAIGDSLYLKRENDSRVYIVPAYIKGSFYKSLEDFREKALYLEDFGKVNQIDYSYGSETFKLVLNGKNSEWLIADTKYAADNVEVANLINNMRNLRISKFVDGTELGNPNYELTNPMLHITMANENGKIYSLKAGALDGVDTFVTVDDKVVQKVETTKLSSLIHPFNYFRDKFLDILPVRTITEINVTDATGTIKISKAEKAWLNGELVVKESDVKDFINSLSRSRIVGFEQISLKDEVGLANLEKASKIELKSKDVIQTIYLGETKGIKTYIWVDNELIGINSGFSDGFEKFLYSLRNSKVIIDKQSKSL